MACDWLCVECLRPVPPAAEPGGADCPGCHGMVCGCDNCKGVLADLRAGSLDIDTPLTLAGWSEQGGAVWAAGMDPEGG